MSDPSTALLAARFAEAARIGYEAFGAPLVPLVAVLGEDRQVFLIPRGDDLAEIAATLTAALVAVVDARHVVTVAEAWYRDVTDQAEADALVHGGLADDVAAGDPRVGTALVTTVWCRPLAGSIAVYDVVRRADDGTVHYDREETDAIDSTGRLAELVDWAWTLGLAQPPPPSYTVERVVEQIVAEGYAQPVRPPSLWN